MNEALPARAACRSSFFDCMRPRTFFVIVALNTLIAAFLTVVGVSSSFWNNLFLSQAVGLSIYAAVTIVTWRAGESEVSAVALALSVLGGAIFGTLLGFLVIGVDVVSSFSSQRFAKSMGFALLFGSFITYLFVSRERAARATASLREAQMQSLAHEKRANEVALKLLRARIEPHFLFNTLSNVIGLIDRDPARGKAMLSDFTQYLRVVLADTRSESTTLEREIDVVRAYLEVFRVRMGDRLRYDIDVPLELRDAVVPSMLVQPLVENAILHGLEPLDQGGAISVRVARSDAGLTIVVEDTGQGLDRVSQSGLGLTSVQQTLRSLYGERARLRVVANQPRGVRAVIELPLER